MSRLTRDGTAEQVSRDQIHRRVRGQGNIYFPCSAHREQDRQPYPVDPYSAIYDNHTVTAVPFLFLVVRDYNNIVVQYTVPVVYVELQW